MNEYEFKVGDVILMIGDRVENAVMVVYVRSRQYDVVGPCYGSRIVGISTFHADRNYVKIGHAGGEVEDGE